MEISQVILQHILATFAVILGGFVIGAGLGILFAWFFRQLYRAAPGLRLPLLLLPWRTLLFALVLFFCSPMAFFLVPSVAREQSGSVYPAMVFSLVVFFFVTDEALTQWLPLSPAVRWAGLARTLAVASSVIVAIGANAAGSGILSYARIMTSKTFTPEAYWTALGVVMGLGLLFDLLLGMLQMLLATAQSRRVGSPAASGGEK